MIFLLVFQPDCSRDEGSWCARIYQLTKNDLLSRYADTVVGTGLRILLILVLAVLIRLMAHRAIKRLSQVTAEGPPPGLLRPLRERAPDSWLGTGMLSTRRSQRARTIGSVLRSGTTLVVYGVAFTLVVGELGINLGPIIASAGILGIALGFGAQNLVKDFLSGMFMLVEDQYGVGDVVDLGEASGTVESVGLRVTTLRDTKGTVWYVRNGEVLRVGNSSQGYSVAVVDLPIGHDADISTSTELAGRTATELTADGSALAADVLEPPQVLGVESISSDGVTLRVTTKVHAGRQWAVQRALLAGIKAAFADAVIPPPLLVATSPRRPDASSPKRQPARQDGKVAAPENFYEAVGGEQTFRRIVGRFYELVAKDEVLRPLYPGEDLEPAEERLRLFLMQYWGGPHTYSQARGHPRLRMRHIPFRIGPTERDSWLRCMRIAVDEADLDDAHRAVLWNYLEMAANSLLNSLT